MADKNFFQNHEAERLKDERKLRDYERGIAERGDKLSSDKGGKTEALRDRHTARERKNEQ